ncbi:MAG: hypothetical protein ACRDMZ_24045, partial [Solirubrobacteraceae bacterium]
ALVTGELVRLGFAFGPHADSDGEGHIERMWVRVVEQAGDGSARAVLRNTPRRLTGPQLGDIVAFEALHVLSIEFSDDELGYAQDQWPIVDAAVPLEDRPPDIVVRAPGPDTTGEDEWWMVCRAGSAGPSRESAGSLTDRFPGLAEPLRAGQGLWELDGGARADARWRRVSEQEIAAGEDWQAFLTWLSDTAVAMREAAREPRDG